MVAHRIEDRIRIKRELTRQAVSLAMASKWEEAAVKNRQIVAAFPNDVEAHNRLGKALSELGNYLDAREALQKVIAINPTNIIARKNLDRIALLNNSAPRKSKSSRVPPHFFIEETGKTGLATLTDKASKATLAKMSAGDLLILEQEGQQLLAKTEAGDRLGAVEFKLGLRLITLMRAGNRYAAAVAAVHGDNIRILIRETYQHPSQRGRLSFPPRGKDEFRPYVWEGIRYDTDEEDRASASENWGEDGEEAMVFASRARRRPNFALAADGDDDEDA